MDNVLLLAFGVPLVVVGIIGLVVWRSLARQGVAAQQRQAELRRRAERGVWAGATVITAVRETGADDAARGAVVVRLRLRVTPPDGQPYDASTTWLVDTPALGSLQSGLAVSVKLDPENTQVVYPNVSWAQYRG